MSTDPRIEVMAEHFSAVTGEPRAGRFEYTMARAALAAADSSATITTFAALDALSEGSVVITKGRVYESAGDGDWYEPGDGGRWTTSSIHLPARVIHFGAQS